MAPNKLLGFLIRLTIVSLALYGTSLFLSAVEYIRIWLGGSSDPPCSWRGYEILLFGWFGILYGMPWWLCNCVYPILFILAWSHKFKACAITACVLSLIAIASLTSIGVKVYIPDNENDRIISLGPSFYFWIASFAVWILAFVPARSTAKSV